MTTLLDTLVSPGLYALLIVVYGFAPGFVLRIILKLYPKGHIRRRELVAELYAVKRVVRPLWVAEQVETALFDGLAARARRRARRRSLALRRRVPTKGATIAHRLEMISIATLFCAVSTVLPMHVGIQVAVNSIKFTIECSGFMHVAVAIFGTIAWFTRHARFCQRYPVGYPLLGWMRRRCNDLNADDRG